MEARVKTVHFLRTLSAAAVLLAAAGCARHADDHVAVQSASPGLRLAPDPVTVNTQLTAVVTAPGVSPATCTFAWACNGQPIAGATTDVLDPQNFHRGDRVVVTVTPPAVNGEAPRPLQAEVRIADAPPVVRSARVSLDPAGGGDDLQATAECVDPDGDETVLEYRWFRNGKPIADASGDRLAAAKFARGDRIAVEAVAASRAEKSEPRRSDDFTLDNRAPRFETEPVALEAAKGSYRYQVKATDPDGDALHYELSQSPGGMTISPEGTIDWSPSGSAPAAGEYAVTVRATDAKGGEATQQFTIRLTTAQVAATKN